jgi:hypothetical protein
MKKVQKLCQMSKNGFNSAKGVVVTTAVLAGTSVLNAAVTFDKTTGALSGTMDTANYYAGVEIGVGFLVITMITGAGIVAMKRFGK